MLFNRILVELVGFRLDNLQSTGRTAAYAVAKPIAELLLNKLSLSVDQLQRSLRAVGNTVTASVTEVFIYLNNLSLLLSHFSLLTQVSL